MNNIFKRAAFVLAAYWVLAHLFGISLWTFQDAPECLVAIIILDALIIVLSSAWYLSGKYFPEDKK